MVYFQQSLFGKMSWERFHQMTGWILEPSYPLSQTPMFQCLLLEDGQEPEWCEGERLTSAGGPKLRGCWPESPAAVWRCPAGSPGAFAFPFHCTPYDTASFPCIRFREGIGLIPGMIWLSCEFIPYYIKRKGKTQDICRNLLKDKKICKRVLHFPKFSHIILNIPYV